VLCDAVDCALTDTSAVAIFTLETARDAPARQSFVVSHNTGSLAGGALVSFWEDVARTAGQAMKRHGGSETSHTTRSRKGDGETPGGEVVTTGDVGA